MESEGCCENSLAAILHSFWETSNKFDDMSTIESGGSNQVGQGESIEYYKIIGVISEIVRCLMTA